MKRCRLKITVTRYYDAEFEDTLAASEMIKALESDPHPTSQSGITTGRWKITAVHSQPQVVSVRPEDLP